MLAEDSSAAATTAAVGAAAAATDKGCQLRCCWSLLFVSQLLQANTRPRLSRALETRKQCGPLLALLQLAYFPVFAQEVEERCRNRLCLHQNQHTCSVGKKLLDVGISQHFDRCELITGSCDSSALKTTYSAFSLEVMVV